MSTRIIAACLAAVVSTLVVNAAAFAARPEIYTARFSNLAVEGYDVVAYFTEGKPVKGDKAFRATHQGAEWLFSSAENLAAFREDPEKYAPQYGGYCAWAVSQNYTARGNPKNWRIVDGRLFLNYNDEIQKRWESDIPGFVAAADANWPAVLE